jgi:hypothetical protein
MVGNMTLPVGRIVQRSCQPNGFVLAVFGLDHLLDQSTLQCRHILRRHEKGDISLPIKTGPMNMAEGVQRLNVVLYDPIPTLGVMLLCLQKVGLSLFASLESTVNTLARRRVLVGGAILVVIKTFVPTHDREGNGNTNARKVAVVDVGGNLAGGENVLDEGEGRDHEQNSKAGRAVTGAASKAYDSSMIFLSRFFASRA